MIQKLFKIGSLKFFQYQTNREFSEEQLYLFIVDFKDRANEFLAQYGIYEHYSDIDLRLYVGNKKPSEFSSRIMKAAKKFETKCLTLGLIDHIKTKNPDIATINKIISVLNKPTKLIGASIRSMILNEYCTEKTGVLPA